MTWLNLPGVFSFDYAGAKRSDYVRLLAGLFDLNADGLLARVRKVLGDRLFGLLAAVLKEISASAELGTGPWLAQKVEAIKEGVGDLKQWRSTVLAGVVRRCRA